MLENFCLFLSLSVYAGQSDDRLSKYGMTTLKNTRGNSQEVQKRFESHDVKNNTEITSRSTKKVNPEKIVLVKYTDGYYCQSVGQQWSTNDVIRFFAYVEHDLTHAQHLRHQANNYISKTNS